MIRRLFLAAVWLASCAMAGPPLTTVQDVLYKADGTRFNGTLVITWSSFQASDTSQIATQSTTVRVQEGNLLVRLVPTGGSTPPALYSVTYNSDGKVQFHETWNVPSSNQPVRLRDVRTVDPLLSGDTTGGSVPVQESDVSGLVDDLNARPLKGSAYAAGRVAMVNDAGTIDSVAGNPNDCVHVDGSSGPCGAALAGASFVDAETPVGVVDGANAQFTLSQAPNPPSSLALYLNGVLQTAGEDYTLNSRALSFVAGSTPQPGDTLLARYRLADGTLSFVDAETPAGTRNGVNAQFTLAGLPNPASSLALYRNGLLMKSGLDYSLNGQLITFVAAALPQSGDLLQASYRTSAGDGSITFVDSDIPSGMMNGVNSQFTLSTAPSPGSTLAVFRNGVLLRSGLDYTLNGQTLLFVSGAEPQAGDTLLASYRLGSGSTGGMSALTLTQVYSAAQVVCTGTGAATTLTTMSSLGTCLIPAGLLQPGDRVEIRFELEHQGAASAFSFEVRWGGTALVHRDASPVDTLATGRADAGVLDSGAQVSFQSWGAVLPFAAGVGTAADDYSGGITVDWQGQLTSPSGDRLALRNFSVVRIP